MGLGLDRGFGAEWAWSERFSVRAEALYMGFGPRDLVFTTPNFGQAANVTHSNSAWLARVGERQNWGLMACAGGRWTLPAARRRAAVAQDMPARSSRAARVTPNPRSPPWKPPVSRCRRRPRGSAELWSRR